LRAPSAQEGAFESNAPVNIETWIKESLPNSGMDTTDRYDLLLDPSDTWTVWDLINDEPAMFGDHLLAGLTEIEAKAARDVMNDAWRRLSENAKLQKRTNAA